MSQPALGIDLNKEARVAWEVQLRVAKLALDGGYYVAAKRNFRKALKIAETSPLDDADISATLIGLGLACCHLKDYPEADELFKRVIQLGGNEPEGLNLTDALVETAVLYQKTGNLAQSKELLEHCLNMLQERSSDNISQAKVMKSLALVNCKIGNINAAELLITKAFAITDIQAVRLTNLFAEILGVMSLIAIQKNQYAEADELMAKAIDILEMATGGEHPEVADFMEYSAEILKDAGCAEKSTLLLKRAKDLRARVKARDK